MIGQERLMDDLGKIVVYDWLSRHCDGGPLGGPMSLYCDAGPLGGPMFFEYGEVKMDKRGMISLEDTPAEGDTKCASEEALEEHVTKRLAEQATEQLARNAEQADS